MTCTAKEACNYLCALPQTVCCLGACSDVGLHRLFLILSINNIRTVYEMHNVKIATLNPKPLTLNPKP
jgi:hypothetical protein